MDDKANIRRMLGALLREEGFGVAEAGNGNAALLMVDHADPDVILLDLLMPPGPDGLETLSRLRERGRLTPVIMMSGKAQLTDAVRAVKLGAFQFLEKPLTPEAVLVTVRAALELDRTRAQNRALQAELAKRSHLVGESPAMQQVRVLIARVGPTEARVLITGESGTGKELVAAAVHAASRRANRAFVTVNCAAIPRDLVESEMFGHERGAFTGATERRLGCFELADAGTLFLDEIAEMDSNTQAKLLRVLQEGTFRRVGGGKGEIQVDVRVIAATNRVPSDAITAGQLREDLFYRLNVFSIHLPPLRERAEDVPLLARTFIEEFNRQDNRQVRGLSSDAEKELERYRWPGNVRELRNVIQRAVVLSGTGMIGAEHLPDNVLRVSGTTPAAASGSVTPIREMERDMILRALEETGQDKRKAAQLLGISLKTLYNKLAKYGIQAVKSARLS